MATYLLGIQLEYENEITDEQIEELKNNIRSLYTATNLVALESAITEWPESETDRYLVKWKKYQGSIIQTDRQIENSNDVGVQNSAAD